LPDSPSRQTSRPGDPARPRVALLFNYTGNFERKIVSGVARYLRQHGPWDLHNLPPGTAPGAFRIDQWQGDGAIAAIYGPRAFGIAAEDFAKLPMPVVNVSNHVTDIRIPRVVVDDHAVGALAAEHLLQCGLRHFAFSGCDSHGSSRLRRAGFLERIEAEGLAEGIVPPSADLADCDDWRSRPQAVDAWLASLPRPLGLMAWTDRRGLWLQQRCSRVGLAVPDDVALIGVDDDEVICDLGEPGLTSVPLPLQRVGYEAAELLADLLAGKPAPVQPRRIGPAEIITRKSTDILAVEDPEVAEALRFIRAAADRPISVADVVAAVSTSRRSLEKRFREHLGRTIHDEIMRVHLLAAKEQLVQTDLSVAEVAARSGFRTVEHFHRAFRRFARQTPARYRKEYRSPR
jgi:LacI family transcriptional regulator